MLRPAPSRPARPKRKRRWTGWLIATLAVAAIAAALWFRPAFTAPIALFDDGKSIASLDQVTLGGRPQWILVRGQDRTKPILLMLLGEPGLAQIAMAPPFRALEADFVVVQWDRLGAGKSYRPGLDPRTLRTSREVADAAELIGQLQHKLGPRPVILLGHGYGSYLGVALAKAHPELIRAYVGVGQSACSQDDERAIQDSWLRQQARLASDPHTYIRASAGGDWDREGALYRYGGELARPSAQPSQLLHGLIAPEYTVREALRLNDARAFSRANLVRDGPATPLAQSVPVLTVPVFFFVGLDDYASPRLCTERYAKALRAPVKQIIWFERSAHYPFLEEPEHFREALLAVAEETAAKG